MLYARTHTYMRARAHARTHTHTHTHTYIYIYKMCVLPVSIMPARYLDWSLATGNIIYRSYQIIMLLEEKCIDHKYIQ